MVRLADDVRSRGAKAEVSAADAIGVKTRENAREKTGEKILRLMQENPNVSADELAVAIGITRKGVEWHISRMKKLGFIERVGADKGGYWKVIK